MMKKALLLCALLVLAAVTVSAQEIRIGLIGLDTSHAIEFTKIFNDPAAKGHVAGARVVAGYPGGSPDVPDSASRVQKFTEQLRTQYHIEIVNDIASMLPKVDAIMIESVDGRAHLPAFRQVIAAHKPVFIDKPMAASYRDAAEIARLAREAGVPWWSGSSMRYAPALEVLKGMPGGIKGASTFGPARIEPTNPGFFWYGIHALEMLYTLMGPGCVEVTNVSAQDADVLTGRWSDGRLGDVRGIRFGYYYGATVYGAKKADFSADFEVGYAPMLADVVKFFQTKVPPVPNEVTLEIMRFMEAAEMSRKNGGTPVKLTDVK